jgi:multiple sugar transport system substrate-binding protein
MKRLLIVFMVFFAAVNLFAGGGGESSPGSDGGKPVTITIWNWDNNVTDITIPAFEAAHPNIKIERVPVTPEELPLKLQQALAAGTNLPDILLAEINQRSVSFAMDIWENLEQPPYNVNRDVFFQSILSNMLNEKGQIIAIDQSLNPTGMAYNKNLARRYFGTDDRAAIEEMFKTLDDYVAKGAEIARASGGTVYMFSTPTNVLRWLWYSNPIKLVEGDGSINYTA